MFAAMFISSTIVAEKQLTLPFSFCNIIKAEKRNICIYCLRFYSFLSFLYDSYNNNNGALLGQVQEELRTLHDDVQT